MPKLKRDVLAEPVLVGRERELEELQRCLDSAINRKGITVFVSGEAGSGKSRLTREFLNEAIKKGVAVLSGWCLSDAAVPYFPFVRAFDSYFSSREEEPPSSQKLESICTLTGTRPVGIEDFGITSCLTGVKPTDKAEKPEMSSPQIWKDQLFDAVGKTLKSIAVHSPLILFMEDIQWADSASLALLHFVSRIIDPERILVLATFRGEELTADDEGRPHPLAETLRVMRRENLFIEIKLSNLDEADTNRLAENMIGGSLQSEFAGKLVAESRGNPLFVVESLRMLSERKSLVREDDEWRLAVEELAIPSKVRDIILSRLAILKYAQRRVLDAASVIGEKFDVELLSAVLGLDSLEVLETLNVIAGSTSLVRGEESYYRFDHMRSRETLYEELSPPLKKGYHARIAERLELGSEKSKLSFSEIAYHFAEAGNTEKALRFSLEAGQDALERFSNAEAIKHFTFVLQSVPEADETLGRRKVALEGLGDAYFANCRFREAMEIFVRLADSGTGAVSLRAVRKALDAGFWWEGDPAHLIELAKKAEPYASFDRLENARVQFFRAVAFAQLTGFEEGEIAPIVRKDLKEALKVFEEEYSLPDAARAMSVIAIHSLLLDSEGKAIGPLLRSAAIFEELGDFPRLIDEALYLGIAFFCCGCFKESWDNYAKALQIGEKIGDFFRMAQASAYLGAALEIDGLVEDALPKTLKAEEYSKKTDASGIEALIHAFLLRQYSKLGDLERAELYFNKLKNFPWETKGTGTNYGFAYQFSRSLAVFHAANNQWEKACTLFKKAFEDPIVASNRYLDVLVRIDFRWALRKQELMDAAQIQEKEIQKIFAEAESKFAQVKVDANLMAPARAIAGQEFELRLDLVNSSKTLGKLLRIEDLVPAELKVIDLPAWCCLENGFIEIKDKDIRPFRVETIRLRLTTSKPGAFTLNPEVTYIDETNQIQTCKPNPVTITVQQAQPKHEVLPGRITTGLEELDRLLFGGIPLNFAVAVSSPSTDERKQLIRRFLETGARAGETTFCMTAEASNTKALVEEYPSSFYLFLCNPQSDAMIQNAPNVVKLKGIENLTDIDIALNKAFRTLSQSAIGPKRICIDITSDVLLQHHAVTTRRWLSALLATLKSKGFTILAVVDPSMHPIEELQAILSVFDGEIRVTEKETPEGIRQVLRVRKLLNQKYLENEIVLSKEKLS